MRHWGLRLHQHLQHPRPFMIYPKRPFQAEAPGCAKGKREKQCSRKRVKFRALRPQQASHGLWQRLDYKEPSLVQPWLHTRNTHVWSSGNSPDGFHNDHLDHSLWGYSPDFVLFCFNSTRILMFCYNISSARIKNHCSTASLNGSRYKYIQVLVDIQIPCSLFMVAISLISCNTDLKTKTNFTRLNSL